MTRETIVIGLGTWGVGHLQPTLWKDPRVPVDASINFNYYRRWAELGEAGLLDFLFLADSQFITHHSPNHEINRLEPFTLLSALAPLTQHIGLVGTASTTYNAPFNLARRFASLELISGGRSGWNVVAGRDSGTAANFGQSEHADHDTRYRMALEHVRVVQGLWDSFEEGAFPADLDTGRFFDPDKLHRLDHRGEFYSVAGPLSVSRSPQGQPVLFQAGGSEQGREFAATIAEGAFAAVRTFEESVAYYSDIKRRAVARGRDADSVLLLPWVTPTVAPTTAEALELARHHFEEDHQFEYLLAQFGRDFHWHDFSVYDPDAPFPDLSDQPDLVTLPQAIALVGRARREKLTLREAVLSSAGATTFRAPAFTGSAEDVADELERWFRGQALDGIKAVFRTEDDIRAFTEHVVPILQQRGLFRTRYEHTTLRGNLGLKVPENRYSRN
ncbi:NtaA/DmoA family FMN-dependent monooxygenase [Leucobacter celer]|uniref:NtaA/DmoA family FMN-dependent monooxygenase n=1 Tax=Leucobacter celer TaxID=668625 RepID=UPI0006A7E77A|nr:NtaA/DmoA family FMN-dependent monooxygenase [Leucobacter celer]